MRKSRFSEEQIISILKEDAGVDPGELCRRHGITRGSLYRWKAKYGGMEVSEARCHTNTLIDCECFLGPKWVLGSRDL